jgi:hypothetical protein
MSGHGSVSGILASALFALCQYFYDTLSNTLFGKSLRTIDKNMAQPNEKQSLPPTTESGPRQTSVKDVLEVKQLLFEKFKLPQELIDVVIDFAEYWPHTTSITSNSPDNPNYVRSGGERENYFLVSRPPTILSDQELTEAVENISLRLCSNQ